jgi:ABC-type dipeptide/oligopeptide/nickel transport system permease subunit
VSAVHTLVRPALASRGASVIRATPGAGSPLVAVLSQLRQNRLAAVSALFLMLLAVVAIAGPALAPYPPFQVRPSVAFSPPSAEHWMGTDHLGRDILSRVMVGSAITLQVAAVSVALSAVLGVALGLVAGFYGRAIDDVIMRATDVVLAFPGILLALGVVAVLRPGLTSIIIAVAFSGIPHFVRVARGATLSAKQDQYIEAARVCGCSDWRIMFRHLLPNVLAPIVVLMTLGLGTAVLTGAGL